MSVRITCPECDTTMTVSAEKRGSKVRCKECDKSITVPAESNGRKQCDEEAAIQDSRKLKVKSANRKSSADDDDDDDDRPIKNRKKASKSGFPVMLVVGGAAAFLLLIAVGVIGIGAIFFLKSSPADAKADIAFANQKEPAKGDPAQNGGIENPIPGNLNPIPNNPIPNNPVPNNPQPIVDPNAGKPLPDQIPPEAIIRVKKATVYLRVTMAQGEVGEGSGFLAVDPGLVITNAHVLGMLKAKSQPPRNVQVVLNSGLPDEKSLTGQVIGVDRNSDLAILRIPEQGLPPPLLLEQGRTLIETQRIYICGFPFGAQLGKNITVTASTITSLRPKEIQVAEGVNPGNSGGPVVNTAGNVVGVSVSTIKGTGINFAIPAEQVHMVMEGRVADANLGHAYTNGSQSYLPVQYTCIDPLRRIRGLRVEIWAGPPGPDRPASVQQPAPAPGDGVKRVHNVNVQNNVGKTDVPLPALAPGQVYWVRPLLATARGEHWGVAIPTATTVVPVERKSANLVANLLGVKERTVKLKAVDKIIIPVGKEKKTLADIIEADLLESIGPDAGGMRIRTAFGSRLAVTKSVDAKTLIAPQQIVDITRTLPPIFMLDPSGKFISHKTERGVPTAAPDIKESVLDTYGRLCNALEASMVPMPNRQVQAQETWQTTVPLPMRVNDTGGGGGPISGKGPKFGPSKGYPTRPTTRWETFDLALTCTFEGMRTRDQRQEALISLVGRGQGRGINAKKILGDVAGTVALDMQTGFISSASIKISQDIDIQIQGGSDLTLGITSEIELTRVAGNPLNIQMPQETKVGPPQAKSDPTPPVIPKAKTDPTPKIEPNPKGKVLLNFPNVSLQPTDFADTSPRGKAANARMKVQFVTFRAGKTYEISVSSNAFMPHVRIEDAKLNTVADQAEKGANNMQSLTFRATTTGVYRVVVSNTDGKTGPFSLLVQEK